MRKCSILAALLGGALVASAQIPVVLNPSIKPYAGFATVWNGQRVVFIDPDRWPTFAPQTQTYILQHEYGHHALHVGNPVPRTEAVKEYEADSYAVSQLIGVFTLQDWIVVLNNVNRDNPQSAAQIAQILRTRGVRV